MTEAQNPTTAIDVPPAAGRGRRAGVPCATPPRAVATADMTDRAMSLRRAGATYRQIGEALGVSRQRAHKIVSDELRRLAAHIRDNAEGIRTLELERLDALTVAHWPSASRGDVPATQTVLRLMERRARLLGLDAPARQEVSGPGGGPMQIDAGLLIAAEARLRMIDERLATAEPVEAARIRAALDAVRVAPPVPAPTPEEEDPNDDADEEPDE